jgi:hypothetical protein
LPLERCPSTITEESDDSSISGSVFTDVGNTTNPRSPVPASVNDALNVLAVAASLDVANTDASTSTLASVAPASE